MKTSIEAALAAPMPDNDAHAVTVGDYLGRLLVALFEQEEAFSGKRPFGNSGWIYEPLTALVRAGVIEGTVDEDGWLDDFDEAALLPIVREAVKRLLVQS